MEKYKLIEDFRLTCKDCVFYTDKVCTRPKELEACHRNSVYVKEEESKSITRKKKKYNRRNCDSLVRATITDRYGRTITLMGKHAFEWSILIEGITGIILIERFNKGIKARERFNQLKKK